MQTPASRPRKPYRSVHRRLSDNRDPGRDSASSVDAGVCRCRGTNVHPPDTAKTSGPNGPSIRRPREHQARPRPCTTARRVWTGRTLRSGRMFTPPLRLAIWASPQRTSIASSARPSPQVLPSGCVPRSCAAAPPLRIAPRRMTGVLGSHGAPRADHAPRMECAWTHRGRNCRSPVVLSGEQCGLALRVKHLPTLHGGGG